jgi:hypothetical protein
MEGVMRKKFMSCVLALMFTVSIAATGFAALEDIWGSSAGPDGQANSSSNNGGDSSSTPAAAKSIYANITNTYQYTGGMLVSMTNAAGDVTILKNGQFFAQLQITVDGTYVLGALSLSGADWDKISKMEGATPEEQLKNYYISLGVSQANLEVQPAIYTDKGVPVDRVEQEDGSYNWNGANAYDANNDGICQDSEWNAYQTRPSENVAWLAEAAAALQNGITYGVTTSFTAAGGATATFSVNGQQQYTLAATKIPTYDKDGKVTGQELFKTQEFVYSSNGFIKEIWSYTFEPEFKNVSANKYTKNKNEWLANNPTKADGSPNTEADYVATLPKNSDGKITDPDYEAYNKALEEGAYTYKAVRQTTVYDEYGRASHVVDAEGNTTSKYKYDINGSLMQVDNLNTKTTITFVNGQQYNIFNANGGLVSHYEYNADRTTNYSVTYNDGKIVAMEVYFRNQSLGSFSMANNDNYTPDQLRAAYFEAKTYGKTEEQINDIAKKYHAISFNVFSSDLGNTNFMKYCINATGSEKPSPAVANLAYSIMVANSNGYSPIGKATFVWGTGGGEKYSLDGKDYKTKEELFDAMWNNGATADKSYWVDKDGNHTNDKSKVDFDKSLEKMKTMTGRTDGWKGGDITYTKDALKNTINFTVYGEGQPLFDISNTITVTEGATSNIHIHDPAVVGTVDSYYDADGNEIEDIVAYRAENPDATIYAKVNAEGVNMMDGSGFQPANGEEIMIDISSLSNEELAALSETGKGLFMGDVNKSVDGKYVMTINKDYNIDVDGKNYGGFVTGADLEKAVAEVDTESKAALNGESKYDWMNANTAQNRSIFGLVNPTQFLEDWRNGWATLALSTWSN